DLGLRGHLGLLVELLEVVVEARAATELGALGRDLLEVPAEEALHLVAVGVRVGVAPEPPHPLQGLRPEPQRGLVLGRLLLELLPTSGLDDGGGAEAHHDEQQDQEDVSVHGTWECPPAPANGPAHALPHPRDVQPGPSIRSYSLRIASTGSSAAARAAG